jgi:hypothetical protein
MKNPLTKSGVLRPPVNSRRVFAKQCGVEKHLRV